jgi:hypothetical protein
VYIDIIKVVLISLT